MMNLPANLKVSLADEIKQRLSLREAARLCAIDLPQRDNAKFASPFRADRNPSCSIYENRLKDWSTGETFDAIDFYAHAKRLSTRDTLSELARHLGIVTARTRHAAADSSTSRTTAIVTRPGLPEEHRQLEKLRGFSPVGQTLAEKIGALSFGTYFDHPCWFVGEKGRPMQARRLDGLSFRKAKALTLPGVKVNHLVGLDRLGDSLQILITEGGPDLIAAICAIHEKAGVSSDIEWCPLALLGSNCRIPEAEAARIRGRRIRICAHPDDAGAMAADRWAKQIGGKIEILRAQADVNDLWKINQAREVLQ